MRDVISSYSLDCLVASHPMLFSRFDSDSSFIHPGWSSVLGDLCCDVEALLVSGSPSSFSFICIKEKFGTLRIVWDIPDPHYDCDHRSSIRKMIFSAKNKIAGICASCGSRGPFIDLSDEFLLRCNDCS